MSVSSRRNEVARHQKTAADLSKKIADESKKEVDQTKKLNAIERSINKSTSDSMLRSKQQQATRIMEEIAKIQNKKADLSKKHAVEEERLGKAKDCLLYTSPSPRDKRQSRMPSSA